MPLRRLERPTNGLGNRCSIQLSYRGKSFSHIKFTKLRCGRQDAQCTGASSRPTEGIADQVSIFSLILTSASVQAKAGALSRGQQPRLFDNEYVENDLPLDYFFSRTATTVPAPGSASDSVNVVPLRAHVNGRTSGCCNGVPLSFVTEMVMVEPWTEAVPLL